MCKVKLKCANCGKIVLRNKDEVNLMPLNKGGLCKKCFKLYFENKKEYNKRKNAFNLLKGGLK